MRRRTPGSTRTDKRCPYKTLVRFMVAKAKAEWGGVHILINNAVAYFDPRPGNPVSLAGGKRINSSNMCPTIATRDGAALFAVGASGANHIVPRSEEHTSELQSLMRISYAVFCLQNTTHTQTI